MSNSAQQGLSRANFNVPTSLWQRFEEVAKANHRSRSDHLRFLMSEAIHRFDEQQKRVADETQREGGR